MTPYFADTFYYLALLNPRDEAHGRAREITARLDRPLLTTAWVLAELGDALCAPADRAAFLGLLDDMRVDPEIEILPPSVELFERGLQRFRERPDKHWSLTDCISFVAMEGRGIREALTGDHHFEQAGFVPLLR